MYKLFCVAVIKNTMTKSNIYKKDLILGYGVCVGGELTAGEGSQQAAREGSKWRDHIFNHTWSRESEFISSTS